MINNKSTNDFKYYIIDYNSLSLIQNIHSAYLFLQTNKMLLVTTKSYLVNFLPMVFLMFNHM